MIRQKSENEELIIDSTNAVQQNKKTNNNNLEDSFMSPFAVIVKQDHIMAQLMNNIGESSQTVQMHVEVAQNNATLKQKEEPNECKLSI